MSWWLYSLLIALGLGVVGFVLYRAIGTGVIWEGIARAATRGAKALWSLLLPSLLKSASPEELARRKRLRDQGGEDAPSARPFNREKDW